MIVAHIDRQYLESHEITALNQELLKEAVWIDLLSPSKEEEILVEGIVDLDIPTREEMAKLELSSRLYKENGALFMIATIISNTDTLEPLLDPVSFVLTERQLITVRYADPKTFTIFAEQFKKADTADRTSSILFMSLLQVNINRLADILEIIGQQMNTYSAEIFAVQKNKKNRPDFQVYMRQIGFNGDLCTKVRDSLLTFDRLTHFVQQNANVSINGKIIENLTILDKDISALSSHAEFLAHKITFLLDATLGLVNIEQNKIIKLFSVVGVIFLPPTLIASMYGMNFSVMPELDWKYGYAFSVVLMLLAAWLPFKYFRHRGWF